MSVATIGDDGLPDARVVLARGVDERGFVFFTNLESAKAQQVASRPVAAATFAWLSLHRQVRLRGVVEPVSADEADATTPAARGRHASARGPRRSPRCSPIGPSSTRWWLPRMPGSPATTSPGRRTGVACGIVPSDGRVLAGPAQPPARPFPLPPRRPRAAPGSSSAWRRESIRSTGGAGSFAGGAPVGALPPHPCHSR